MDQEVEQEIGDPFDAEYAPGFTLLTLMRVYDVLMEQLSLMDAGTYNRLVNMHEAGKLRHSFPTFNPGE